MSSLISKLTAISTISYSLELNSFALEIFRLVENREEIIRSKSWSTIANSIAAELRTRGIKGYTIHTPHAFDVPRLKIPGFVSKTADRLEAALKQNPRPAPEVATTYSCRIPITTFASVEAFTFSPLRIARIVLRSTPVSLVVFRNPRVRISAIKLSLAATRPPS